MLVDAQVHESANYDHVYYVEEADALDLVKDDWKNNCQENQGRPSTCCYNLNIVRWLSDQEDEDRGHKDLEHE